MSRGMILAAAAAVLLGLVGCEALAGARGEVLRQAEDPNSTLSLAARGAAVAAAAQSGGAVSPGAATLIADAVLDSLPPSPEPQSGAGPLYTGAGSATAVALAWGLAELRRRRREATNKPNKEPVA